MLTPSLELTEEFLLCYACDQARWRLSLTPVFLPVVEISTDYMYIMRPFSYIRVTYSFSQPVHGLFLPQGSVP